MCVDGRKRGIFLGVIGVFKEKKDRSLPDMRRGEKVVKRRAASMMDDDDDDDDEFLLHSWLRSDGTPTFHLTPQVCMYVTIIKQE